jgi:DNA invertase Pin-like site-specific DNA recombinase
MLSVMGAIHEFDRSLIKERQREGIALAKKKLLSLAEVAELRQRIARGMSKAQVARELGISRKTLYKYLRQGNRIINV